MEANLRGDEGAVLWVCGGWITEKENGGCGRGRGRPVRCSLVSLVPGLKGKGGNSGLQAAGSPVMAALLWLLFWPLLLEAESKGGPGSVANGEEEMGNQGRFLVGFWLREVGITESRIRGLEAGIRRLRKKKIKGEGGPFFFGGEGTVFLWGSLLFAGKMESKLVLVLD